MCTDARRSTISRTLPRPFGVGGPGRIGVRMLLHDEGNADKAITSAAAIFDIVS